MTAEISDGSTTAAWLKSASSRENLVAVKCDLGLGRLGVAAHAPRNIPVVASNQIIQIRTTIAVATAVSVEPCCT